MKTDLSKVHYQQKTYNLRIKKIRQNARYLDMYLYRR